MTTTGATQRIWLGRAREMGELEAGLDALMLGRGGVFLFVGEPGIGKTRLADEAGRTAARRGASVHWGRAWEVGGAPSYWPFVQLLRSIVRGRELDALVGALGAHARALGALIPELRPGAAEPRDDGAESARDRFQLFEAVAAFLRLAAVERPLVLVLDDLHAADPSSLLLLRFLVRDLRDSPLLLIGTYRDAEARISRETGTLLAQVAREAAVLPLRRLDRAEVAEFLATSIGESPAPARVDAVLRQTEGNPLFLWELLRLGTNRGPQPEGIREVIRARLALLSTEVRETLEMGAVLGRDFELEWLARMTGRSPGDVTSALVPAIEASILELTDDYRFAHVLLRESLYAELAPGRRAELHAAAARALDETGGARRLAERAHHMLHAVPVVSVEEAALATLRAGEQAMDLLAFEDARDLLTRAARQLEGESRDERLLFEVLLGLGLARIRGAEVDDGKVVCLRAAELARELGDGERFARAVLGCAYEYAPGVRNTRLIALLEDALTMLPPGDGALRARCMAQLAAERQPEPDTRGPIDLAHAAVAMARRLGEKDTLRFTLTAAGLALMVYGEPEERIALNQETLRLAQAAHDKRLALRAHLLLFNDHWEEGAINRADAHVDAYESIAGEFPHGAFHWTLVGIRAANALWRGRFEEAERLFRETEELARKDATRGTSMAALPVGFACARECYDTVGEIELRTREAFGSAGDDLGSCLAELLIARLHGRTRARDEAARQLAVVRAHPVFPQIREAAWLTLLVEACQLLGDVPLATDLYAVLAPRARRFFNLGHLGPWCEPPFSRQLGLLAHTLGRLDEAVLHLTDAEARTAAVGMRAHLARLRLELAEALIARASTGDDARAHDLLASARAVASELGQVAIVRFIDERGAPSLPKRAASPVALSVGLVREGEYWTVTDGTRVARLKDSRGLRVLHELLASPGQEFHVLQLATPGDDDAPRGDAGPALDPEAIQAYRTRLLDLREELGEAEAFADEGRRGRIKTEIEALTEELARGVGLGGRGRRVGDAAERARTTVQKRLREAIRRIDEELPEVGRHLEQTVRTGAFCGYFPEGRARPRSGK